ncbi:MAG: putative quinol monooxygenase [Gemmataceae bacterium]
MKKTRLLSSLAVLLFVLAADSARGGNPIIDAAKTAVSDPKKPFTMVVIVTVKEGKGKEFEDAFAPALKETRKEKGNIAYDLNRDLKDAAKYYVYERWRSIAALETHMETPHIKTLLSKLADLTTGAPETKFFAIAGE